MPPRIKRHSLLLALRFVWLLPVVNSAFAAPRTQLPPQSPCAHLPHADHPTASLSNGKVDLVVFLPDARNGYYRSIRFDWSGLVACASFAGHRYFGEWSDGYDPLRTDAVVGPAEEFRAPEGRELGYTDAAVGDSFVKIGVGLLRKVDDGPYRFGTSYPLLDSGTWKVTAHPSSIVFTQQLNTALGVAYEYTKVLELDRNRPVLRLKHTLRNLGTKAIVTEVYDHDFFTFDDQPVGPGVSVALGFIPRAPKPLGSAVRLEAKAISFVATPSATETAQGYLEGYAAKPGEYRIEVLDSRSGAQIVQSSRSPISRFYLWSTRRTLCPEAYIALDIAPRSQQQWEIAYEFGAAK